MGRGFKGLFAGGLLGVLAGLLFAPQKGEESRKKVKEVLDSAKEKGEKIVGEIREKIDKEKSSEE